MHASEAIHVLSFNIYLNMTMAFLKRLDIDIEKLEVGTLIDKLEYLIDMGGVEFHVCVLPFWFGNPDNGNYSVATSFMMLRPIGLNRCFFVKYLKNEVDSAILDIRDEDFYGGGSAMKSKVYFSRDVTSDTVIKMYEVLERPLSGKVAAKVHSGEEGNQNYLRPSFWKPMIDKLGTTVVECNTAYAGERNSTEKHKKLMKAHGWTDLFDVDIMDAEGPDLHIDIPNGIAIKENQLGKNITNYDSMIVLAHFKGHPAGGYGGALKQLSIGCASTEGKCIIHSAGFTRDQTIVWEHMADQDVFCEAMADAAKSVTDLFGDKVVYINIMANLSVDCDCCAVAEDPCMADIGILSSTDPVALDQACMDLIYASDDPGRDHFIERVESRHGIHTIEAAEQIGVGSRDYELIEID